MLALRDELRSRDFDLPGAWWPDQPGVIGGRDRQAGGSWCVCDVESGVTAVVLNRPEKKSADPGAPSRGVLPLLAAERRELWPDAIELAGMAGFNLVLATPTALHWWSFDGDHLKHEVLPGGTYMFTPGGLLRSGFDSRLADPAAGFHGDLGDGPEQVWAEWLGVVDSAVASADPSDLLVRKPSGDDSFETVFGQLIAARPGALRVDYAVSPGGGRPWTTARWTTEHRET
jgi:hypothetical protein